VLSHTVSVNGAFERWLALRPGTVQRERFLAFQSILTAARDHGLLKATEQTATYLRIVPGEKLTPAKIQQGPGKVG